MDYKDLYYFKIHNKLQQAGLRYDALVSVSRNSFNNVIYQINEINNNWIYDKLNIIERPNRDVIIVNKKVNQKCNTPLLAIRNMGAAMMPHYDFSFYGNKRLNQKKGIKINKYKMSIENIRAIKEAAQQPKVKEKYYIPKVSAKRKLQIEKDKDNRKELEQFYKDAAIQLSKRPFCEECGAPIPKEYYRHATAHIFPKSIYESVSSNYFNKLFLGAGCGCHSRFDSNIENASKMKVWNKAVTLYLQFKPLIKEKHKYQSLFESKIS